MIKSEASTFKKLTHREHVLLRPEMYIGSVAVEPCAAWIVKGGEGGGDKEKEPVTMVRNDALEYSPGLLKIFDEIVVNAIDHAVRSRANAAKVAGGGEPVKKGKKRSANEDDDDAKSCSAASDADAAIQVVKKIMVSIDPDTGVIEISNDGDGIPVEHHAEQGCYVPELIFGHMLTSANYDDEGDGAKRTVGGQNGIGAKACNILSKWFEIEVIDRVRHLRYRQKFERNMEVTGAPKIDKSAVKKASTVVRFLPDYGRLGMKDGRLSDDMRALMERRVWDACAVTPPDVAVWLNGKKLDVKSFERYVDLYVGGKGTASRAYERPLEGWEVAAALSDGTGLQHVSFVNGVATLRGGKHVDHVVNQICRKLCELIAKNPKRKGLPPPKPQYVRDNLFVFVRATIPGPRFDSQSKETLTTPAGQFGGKVEISDAFVDKLSKVEGLVERIVSLSGAAIDKEAKKTDGSKRSTVVVPKLDDAEWAGTAKSDQCTLILTEGDSAKASAVAGLSVVGRQKYGVFPLRGKVMNVCDVSADKIAANAEISAIKKILGLQNGKVYTNTAELRYGRVFALVDADLDGGHIKGLVLNLFLQLWPSLLKIDGFFCTLLTPIVKAWPGGVGGKNASPLEFYNLGDYKRWVQEREQTGNKIGTMKYFKGLGSSSAEEAKDWFRRMRLVAYIWDDESKESMMKAFDKKRADDRKAWLRDYDPQATLDYGKSDVNISEFIEKELVFFSIYDVQRSIPCVIDGLKISQRKALFGCRKRNLYKGEVRVAQLASYAAEHSCFHHGETSMQGTIITMAQDFVGSGNNVPLLEAFGQFGTRLAGGDDSASPRYIHTRLTKAAALLFSKDDDMTLDYLDDDGIMVEPKYYVPIIPLALLNGAFGVGTGFSTNVPSFDPLEVVDAVREWIASKKVGDDAPSHAPGRLTRPWYRGFVGTIEETPGSTPENLKLRSRSVVARVKNAPTKVKVTELPLGLWTEDFKTSLESLVEAQSDVKGFSNESTDVKIDFTIHFATAAAVDAWLAPASASDPSVTRLESELKLVGTKLLSMSNMHLFTAAGTIKKYATPLEIVDDFCKERLKAYVKRKAALLERLRSEAALLRNKVLFIEAVSDGRLVLHGKKGKDDDDDKSLEAEMEALGLERQADEKAIKVVSEDEDDDDDSNKNKNKKDDGESMSSSGSFKYLLGMPMASMTVRRKEALDAQLRGKLGEIKTIEETTSEDMWMSDLDAVAEELKKV